MAHRQPSTRKSGQNANKNLSYQNKSTKSKLPLNGELYELPPKDKTPAKLATNSSQSRQQQQQRQTKLTKLVQDAKRTDVPRSNGGAKGQAHCNHQCHQQDNRHNHHLDQPQSSRCMQRCGGGANCVTAANLKSHSKPSATTTTTTTTATTTTKIDKRQSDTVTMKETKAKVKSKPVIQTDMAANLIQEQRQQRDKKSNNHTKNFFDKYLKFAYDLTTPEGVMQLEAHFFPPTAPPQHEQQQKQQQHPQQMEKNQHMEGKSRNDARSHNEDPTEFALNQSKYFS